MGPKTGVEIRQKKMTHRLSHAQPITTTTQNWDTAVHFTELLLQNKSGKYCSASLVKLHHRCNCVTPHSRLKFRHWQLLCCRLNTVLQKPGYCSRYSALITGCKTRPLLTWSHSRQRQKFFSSPKLPDRLWGPPNLLSGHRGLFLQVTSSRGLELTTHLHLSADSSERLKLYLSFPLYWTFMESTGTKFCMSINSFASQTYVSVGTQWRTHSH